MSIVVDPSAAVAVLVRELAADWVALALDRADKRLMSAASYVELGIVLEAKLGPVGGGVAARFLDEAVIELVPVDKHHADAAITAYRRFGKGRHPAALNFGDCFVYALAVSESVPVLSTRTDFEQTDIAVVSREAHIDSTD